jgi:hypothetical protein
MINLDSNYINEGLIEDNKTIFFTITNEGYLDYTKNMLESLKRLDCNKKILVVCIDEKSNEYFISKGYFTYLIDLKFNQFSKFGTEDFAKVTYIKLYMIYKFLEMNYNILITDGDIYYNKNPITEIYQLKDKEGDMWIQNDSLDEGSFSNLCSGFIYIKSNDITKRYFNIEIPEFKDRYKFCSKSAADQTYINLFVAPYLNTHILPLYKFPNGIYFYNFSEKIKDSVVMVHFNWVVGQEKQKKMKKYGMWII